MKGKRSFFSVLAVSLLSGCSGGGSGGTPGNNRALQPLERIEIPSTLGGLRCSPEFLNNKSQVVLSCGTEGETFKKNYVLWSGGDTLTRIAAPASSMSTVENGYRTYTIDAFSDDAAFIGRILEVRDVQDGPEGALSHVEVISGYRLKDGKEELFPLGKAPLIAVSDSGRFIVTTNTDLPVDDVEHRNILLDNLSPVPLKAPPKDVFFDFGSPDNSGRLIGLSVVGVPTPALFQRYPSSWSTDDFHFLTTVEGSEFKVAAGIVSNNVGDFAFSYEVGAMANGQPRTQGTFISRDGARFSIDLPASIDALELNGINDKGIVIGDAYELDPQENETQEGLYLDFVYSQRSGVQQTDSFFPENPSAKVSHAAARAINDRNELLVSLPEESGEAVYLIRLPEDF